MESIFFARTRIS